MKWLLMTVSPFFFYLLPYSPVQSPPAVLCAGVGEVSKSLVRYCRLLLTRLTPVGGNDGPVPTDATYDRVESNDKSADTRAARCT